MNEAKGKRDNWSGSLGFILAAAGSAIGLGNVWKFPYITGMNGGGAFVLVYLGCVLLVGYRSCSANSRWAGTPSKARSAPFRNCATNRPATFRRPG